MAEKIDVVYKLGPKSDYEDFWELRFSIRSVIQHFKDIRNIIIVGVKPRWWLGKFITVDDIYTDNKKDVNLINKLIIACIEDGVSERFINMSDDIILMNDLTTQDLEIPYQIEPKQKKNNMLWYIRYLDTTAALKNKGLSSTCFEGHCPYLLNSKLYPHIMFKHRYTECNGMLGNTLYYNTLGITGHSKSNWVYKVNQGDTVDYSKLNQFKCLNLNARIKDIKMVDFLEKKFPVKHNKELSYTNHIV